MNTKIHKIFVGFIIICVIILPGCTKTKNIKLENRKQENIEQEPLSVEIPALPQTGKELSDFVADGWELLDHKMMDFNEDGIMDYVGILDAVLQEEGGGQKSPPRILFAIESDRPNGYRLSFQDANLIRARDEGGYLGTPYSGMTAKKDSFTIYRFGGDGEWGEEDTYTYKEGIWYLTASSFGYARDSSYYGESNNWETGVGIRQRWGRDYFYDDAKAELVVPDIEYELSLEEPITLYQAGMRGRLAPDRRTEWNVASIVFADGITISEDSVILPGAGMSPDYNDENGIVYTFYDENSENYYLARYQFEDQSLHIVAGEKEVMDNATVYKDKIYYTTSITGEITYKAVEDGVEVIRQEENTIGMVLNRMNLDGTGAEAVFEYHYPKAEQEVLEYGLPYMTFQYEISGNEIVVEVYFGFDEPHPFFRMNLDGSEVCLIGICQVPQQ